MGLSCYCDEDFEHYYEMEDDYSINKRKKMCYDCKSEIPKNSLMLKGYFFDTDDDGNEINIKNIYFCEKCADTYFNLTELNYCIVIGEPGEKTMQECLQQYKKMTTRK